MDNSCIKFSVPEELREYCLNYPQKSEFNLDFSSFVSDVTIKRDDLGQIVYIDYISSQKGLEKRVFYKNNSVSKVNYYTLGKLSLKEEFEDDRLILKSFYNNFEKCLYSIKYEYDYKSNIETLRKNVSGNEIFIKYYYDDIGRVIERCLFYGVDLITSQHYSYDILNRILEYEDERIHIQVQRINKAGLLEAYKIDDKFGNNIEIENYFDLIYYKYSKVTINGHSKNIVNNSYLDNLMLKAPYASENDIELCLMNYLNSNSGILALSQIKNEDSINLEKSNKIKALPISIRKRYLYRLVS